MEKFFFVSSLSNPIISSDDPPRWKNRSLGLLR
jgi:hypothetical protein